MLVGEKRRLKVLRGDPTLSVTAKVYLGVAGWPPQILVSVRTLCSGENLKAATGSELSSSCLRPPASF